MICLPTNVSLFVLLQEREKKEEEERIRMENIMTGNPLLNTQSNFKVKRRYHTLQKSCILFCCGDLQ